MQAQIQALERRCASLERQLRASVAISRSTAPSVDGGVVQTNQGQIDPLSLRDGMPTLYAYGFSSSLPVGGDKVVVFLNGDRSQGVVVATGHQDYRFTGLAEGEVVVHDMWGHSVRMTAAGIVIEGGAHAVTINSAAKVRVEAPRLEVTGDIIDRCDTQPHTQADLRGIYDVHTHAVHNVLAGGSTVTTAVPDQQE